MGVELVVHVVYRPLPYLCERAHQAEEQSAAKESHDYLIAANGESPATTTPLSSSRRSLQLADFENADSFYLLPTEIQPC